MSGDLNLSVDRASEIPVGTQLAWKLRTLIGTGRLEPGDRLPGIRELAAQAGVNVNTVRSVLARLEEQGLVVTEQGRGSFVADAAQQPAVLARTAAAVLSQARAAGIDPRELAAALYIALPDGLDGAEAGQREADTRPPDSDERAQRRHLRAEIARIERELAELEPLGPIPERVTSSHPRVLDTSELRDVRDALLTRLDQLHADRREWRADAVRRRAEREPDAPRSRRWAAGVWTSQADAKVSWTTA